MTTTPLPYIECRDCWFWVRPQDEHCPNCGIVRPQFHVDQNDYFARVASNPGQHVVFSISAVSLILFVLTLLVSEIINWAQGPAGIFPVLLVTSALTVLIARLGLVALRRSVGVRSNNNVRLDRGLRQAGKTISARIKDIDIRRAQIQAVRARVSTASGTAEWKLVRERLTEVDETLKQHRARYSAKLIEIEAVRWQNKLTPVLYGWEGLTYADSENRLQALGTATTVGNKLGERLQVERATLVDAPDAAELANRIEETLTSCKKAHDGLVGRQAVLALTGISPLKDAVNPVAGLNAERKEMEAFNCQVSITDFSASFAELEAEHARLLSEDVIAQEIGHIFEQTDRLVT